MRRIAYDKRIKNSPLDGYFESYMKARTLEKLTETSLNIVFDHFLGKKKESFSLFSCCTKEGKYTGLQPETKERRKKLQWFTGFYLININTYLKEADGSFHYENSRLVVDITADQSQQLAEALGLDFYIYSGSENDFTLCAYDREGRITHSHPEFSPAKIAEFFAEYKGKPVVFEYSPINWMVGMAIQGKVAHIPGFVRWQEKPKVQTTYETTTLYYEGTSHIVKRVWSSDILRSEAKLYLLDSENSAWDELEVSADSKFHTESFTVSNFPPKIRKKYDGFPHSGKKIVMR